MIEALYLHIPFCAKRCAYCDFPTAACNDESLMDDYVEAMQLAIRRASRAGLLSGVKTVYIGGGTPTYLGAKRLNSLVYLLSVSMPLENVEEFTLEANPDSLTPSMVRDLFALGVDRFSIGAQSFDDGLLARYGRIHDAASIYEAVDSVKQRTDRFSLDLICAGPGQDMDSWLSDVQRAVDTGARHLSVYPLMLEEGTPLCRAVDEGRLSVPDGDAAADMMEAAAELLEGVGMRRYEVASYAFPGYEARHNEAYWTGVEYLGLGAGASSMLSRDDYAACLDAQLFGAPYREGEASIASCLRDSAVRVRVRSELDRSAYCASAGAPDADIECLSAKEMLLEDAMLGMRMSEGIAEDLVEACAFFTPGIHDELDRLAEAGLVEHKDMRWVPTRRGWLCGNDVFGAIWGLASA